MWWDIARHGVYPLIACVALFLFWRAFKKTAMDQLPLGVPVGEFATGRNGGNGHAAPGDSGAVTVEVLNRLIRENPQNMSHAIRSWMAEDRK